MSVKRKSKIKAQPLPTPSQKAAWESKVILKEGESLRLVGRVTAGNLAQDDVEDYEVFDALGGVTGAVRLWVSTSLKPPFRTSYRLEQRDALGSLIAQERC